MLLESDVILRTLNPDFTINEDRNISPYIQETYIQDINAIEGNENIFSKLVYCFLTAIHRINEA